MSPLPNEDKRFLLGLARRAIVEMVSRSRLLEIPSCSGNLASPGRAFVTLYRGRHLRGCIGSIESSESLAATIVHSAVGAANHDPRFAPVGPDELSELTIEISILSPLQPIQPDLLEVGRHGVVVRRDQRRGVLLPKVAAEHGWTRERFLEEACRKAGLPPDSWRDPATQCFAFTDEVFSESSMRESDLPARR